MHCNVSAGLIQGQFCTEHISSSGTVTEMDCRINRSGTEIVVLQGTSRTDTGAQVDCVVSKGLVLKQWWTARYY